MRARIFSGVSAGAFDAAALAVGMDAAALAELWRGIRWSDVARLRTDVHRLANVNNPAAWRAVEHLLASAAVPVVFPPVEIDGRFLVDAGTVANTPLAPVMDYEPDAVIVISGGGGTRPAPAPASLGETIGLLVDNLAHFALRADLDHATTVNTLVREAPGATDRRHVPLLLVEPHRLAFSAGAFFRFTAEDADRVMGFGYERGAEALAGWDGLSDGAA